MLCAGEKGGEGGRLLHAFEILGARYFVVLLIIAIIVFGRIRFLHRHVGLDWRSLNVYMDVVWNLNRLFVLLWYSSIIKFGQILRVSVSMQGVFENIAADALIWYLARWHKGHLRVGLSHLQNFDEDGRLGVMSMLLLSRYWKFIYTGEQERIYAISP